MSNKLEARVLSEYKILNITLNSVNTYYSLLGCLENKSIVYYYAWRKTVIQTSLFV